MRTTTRGFILVSCLLAACASDEGAELLDGFSPPAPNPGEVQYLSPIVRDVQPGEDRVLCTYLDAFVENDSDIGRIAGYTTAGNHHAVLYQTAIAQPANTHVCKDDEMIFLSWVGGIGGEGSDAENKLPEGLVRRVKGGNQLMIQSHWLNATDEALDGQAAFNVSYEPVSPDKLQTNFMAVMNTELEVPPGTSSAFVECTFEDKVNIWQLAGHEHDLGTHVRMAFTPSGGTERVLFDEDWNNEWAFNPKYLDYAATPLVASPGDKLRIDCDWNNKTPDTVRFPREMCGAVGEFFPGSNQLICANGGWVDN
jgi:hypothetical protein